MELIYIVLMVKSHFLSKEVETVGSIGIVLTVDTTESLIGTVVDVEGFGFVVIFRFNFHFTIRTSGYGIFRSFDIHLYRN